jgi:type I restriction-modification system DNA methylase subunit
MIDKSLIIFDKYLKSVSEKYSHKETSEVGYRTELELLLKEIFDKINVKRVDNDPRAKEGNRPDFIIYNHSIPILYIETKDIGIDLNKEEKSEQMARYFGYANLVLTDYLEFRFYRNGLPYGIPIKLGQQHKESRKIEFYPDNYQNLSKSLIDFARTFKEPIQSGKHLSQIMGGKAQRIRDNVKYFLSVDSDKNIQIKKVYDVIKKQLVHDLTSESFADMYAQTLVYGLFVARYHDDSKEAFSRQKARDLIPPSNPLLRHFFDHIAGTSFDERLKYIVNELCEVFDHSNVQVLMQDYFGDDLWGEKNIVPDPVIHFYEDFLKEYDPELRKKLGAFYTPLPVVRFIVRSVDKILEKDFGLASGLADTSKTENGTHRVQILDPATGTGTFISATIREIYKRLLDNGQKGRWTSYVHNDLLPRIHGFEIMMAPYTIAHLKLSMAFKETGFKYFNRRLGIYLTNSLEESEEKEDLFSSIGFAESIAEESKEAAIIKNETPIMVVLGNPPYSISSSNKGEWINKLVKDYKRNIIERNVQPLSDDYIKFIRFAEYFIEKNQSGIVAMITNNSFIDGITHRQMRKHLLDTFDDIYIFDLHGNSKKKEKAPDGSKDENVFDIMQGVSISIFIKNEKEKIGLGNVYHTELYGLRENKFKFLNENDIHNIKWNKLEYTEPYYFFISKDFRARKEYEEFFPVNNFFNKKSSGIKTHRDHFIIDFEDSNIKSRLDNFADFNISNNYLSTKYKIKDTRDWKLNLVREKFQKNPIEDLYYNYLMKPFDLRRIYYSNILIELARMDTVGHMIKGNNLALVIMRSLVDTKIFNTVMIGKYLVDINFYGFQTYVFPLYLYSEDGTKIPNLKKEIVNELEKITGNVTPEEILDYIYAVLHSPTYREKYKEFLKIDFPRIPYPKDKKIFKKLVKFGTELRLLHLLESPKLNKFITTYPKEGTDIVEKVKYAYTNVIINEEQFFGNVPEVAWNFYIGGYQPAQKWLKDRKGRTLTNEDIEHYQKIIVALTETDRIMREIEKIKIL